MAQTALNKGFLAACLEHRVASPDTVLTDNAILGMLGKLLEISKFLDVAWNIQGRAEAYCNFDLDWLDEITIINEITNGSIDKYNSIEQVKMEDFFHLFDHIPLPLVWFFDQGDFVGDSVMYAYPRLRIANFLSGEMEGFFSEKLSECELSREEVLAASIGAYTYFANSFASVDMTDEEKYQMVLKSPLASTIAIWTNFVLIKNPLLDLLDNLSLRADCVWVPWPDVLSVASWYDWFEKLERESDKLNFDISGKSLFDDILRFSMLEEVSFD
jgi:hypothetical protein